jgi:hypothetical protein
MQQHEIDFQKEGGIIEIGRGDADERREITYTNRCEKCGAHTMLLPPALNAERVDGALSRV